VLVNPDDGSLMVTVYGQRVRLSHDCEEGLHRIVIDHPE
jgi:hypothetical protein